MSVLGQAASPASADDTIIERLLSGPLHAFADWPIAALPDRAIGIYTIWDLASSGFVYVGVAGGKDAKQRPRMGLWRRLDQHQSGDRSGDRFCIYVQDRFVLPMLSRETIEGIARRDISLDQKVREHVRAHLGFRYAETSSIAEARRIEDRLKRGASQAGPPSLNPLRARARSGADSSQPPRS